ncbi:MAG: hypothetical protein JW725_02210 [Candidatus Babeliaceae bacterium]|nr:hypothetical protein [Candidatus Babeliaceae bacterium]
MTIQMSVARQKTLIHAWSVDWTHVLAIVDTSMFIQAHPKFHALNLAPVIVMKRSKFPVPHIMSANINGIYLSPSVRLYMVHRHLLVIFWVSIGQAFVVSVGFRQKENKIMCPKLVAKSIIEI